MKHATDSKAPATTTARTTAAHAAPDTTPAAAPASELHLATTPRERAAFEQMLPLARALDRDALLPLNVDPSTTATTCVGVARRMAQFRDFLAKLPDFDVTALDELEPAGLALAVAQAQYRATVTPPDSLAELVDRGTTIRTTLQRWGEALADGGLINPTTVAALRSGTSHRDVAIALTSWVMTYRGADWAKIQSVSLVTERLLDEAESVSQRILAVLGYRDVSPERTNAAAELRQRMFTLAATRHSAVRRAATFMRWNFDDVDDFAPSLYAKGPQKADKRETPAPASAPSSPAAPNANPTAHAAPPAAAPADATPPVQDVGLPNSSPFTRS